MREDIKSMTLEELRGAMAALGQPAFRAGQIYTWLHRGAVSFQEMTNLSKDLRQQLEARYEITAPQVVRPAGKRSVFSLCGEFAVPTSEQAHGSAPTAK